MHTRERMVKRFKDGSFVYPGALFRLTPEELERLWDVAKRETTSHVSREAR